MFRNSWKSDGWIFPYHRLNSEGKIKNHTIHDTAFKFVLSRIGLISVWVGVSRVYIFSIRLFSMANSGDRTLTRKSFRSCQRFGTFRKKKKRETLRNVSALAIGAQVDPKIFLFAVHTVNIDRVPIAGPRWGNAVFALRRDRAAAAHIMDMTSSVTKLLLFYHSKLAEI